MDIPGYRILRTIGKGAMATAYLAETAGERRTVVLKVLHQAPWLADDEPAATLATSAVASPGRMAREARIIASLDHPNIVRLYQSGETDGLGFIVMEYLKGGDLETRIARGMEVRDALGVTAAIAGALAHAHRNGILHRDVKPQNILFRGDGTPVLSDFGVAKRLDDELKLTLEGTAIGSPLYMSPEQAGGGEVDGRTDIYALGVVLFEMLTGRPPFTGGSAVAVILKHLHGDIPRLPEPLAGLQPLVDGMLAKAPDARIPSADQVAQLARGFAERITATGLFAPPPGERAEAAPAEDIPPKLFAHLRAGIEEDLAFDRLILPSLPEVAMKVRDAVADPVVPAERVARLIAVDPSLSAQVMKMANSAFYPGRARVADLKAAVVRLGGMAVRHLVMVVVAAQLFQAKRSPDLGDRLREAWQRSVQVAALSRVIAQWRGGVDPDGAFLAGLLHRVGLLPVLEWALQIPHLFADPAQLEAFVRRTQADMGALILTRWNYPEPLVAAVRDQDRVDPTAPGEPDFVHVVALAGRLADALGPEGRGQEAPPRVFLGEPLEETTRERLLDQGRESAAAVLEILQT